MKKNNNGVNDIKMIIIDSRYKIIRCWSTIVASKQGVTSQIKTRHAEMTGEIKSMCTDLFSIFMRFVADIRTNALNIASTKEGIIVI
ncbi:hypothetical protein [Kluyvera intermedia]|jgi:hypothetical protein|uniref:hypothetical protein n=1 Tax=Kluyvera intermedia TaxID=61648 RepID=UPI003523AEF4